MTLNNKIFRFSASLRIKGASAFHSALNDQLGIPSACHVAGDEVVGNEGKKWRNDMWLIDADIDENQDINDHLAWIKNLVIANEVLLKDIIKHGSTIDIYISYDCDEEHRGFSINSENLKFIVALGLKLEVSILR
jgi:hypothetical protein